MTRQLRVQAGVRLEAAADGTPRRLTINACGGGAMTVSGYGAIVLDLSGLELPSSVPILAGPESELASVVGSGTPSTDGKTPTLDATLADSEAGDSVLSLLDSGVDLRASVGCESIQTRRVERGATATHLRGPGIDPGPRRDVEGMIRAAGTSNASLSNLLSNALNKTLEMQWPQAPGTWRSWCAVRAANDFKVAKSLRPVFNGELEQLGPTGEMFTDRFRIP